MLERGDYSLTGNGGNVCPGVAVAGKRGVGILRLLLDLLCGQFVVIAGLGKRHRCHATREQCRGAHADREFQF